MNNDNIRFALRKIETEQFAINEDGYVKGEKINLSNEFRFGADFDRKIIKVSTYFKFEILNIPFLLFGVSCYFEIEPESWNCLINKSELVLPSEAATHLLLLTIGTARGVLHAKTENTKFNNYYLPTLDVSQMITENIRIPFL